MSHDQIRSLLRAEATSYELFVGDPYPEYVRIEPRCNTRDLGRGGLTQDRWAIVDSATGLLWGGASEGWAVERPGSPVFAANFTDSLERCYHEIMRMIERRQPTHRAWGTAAKLTVQHIAVLRELNGRVDASAEELLHALGRSATTGAVSGMGRTTGHLGRGGLVTLTDPSPDAPRRWRITEQGRLYVAVTPARVAQ